MTETKRQRKKVVQYYTPTGMCRVLGVAPREINLMLERLGFQEKIQTEGRRYVWRPTPEKGAPLSKISDEKQNPQTGQPYRLVTWHESILDMLSTEIAKLRGPDRKEFTAFESRLEEKLQKILDTLGSHERQLDRIKDRVFSQGESDGTEDPNGQND